MNRFLIDASVKVDQTIASGITNDSENPALGATIADVIDSMAENLNTLLGTVNGVKVTAGPGANQITLSLDSDGLNIKGRKDGSVAAAGEVGELLTASAADVAITSGTSISVTSLVLTPGSWEITGLVVLKDSANAQPFTAAVTALAAGLGTVNNVMPADPFSAVDVRTPTAPAFNMKVPTPPRSADVSANTTIYLICNTVFAGGSVKADGYLRARRVR